MILDELEPPLRRSCGVSIMLACRLSETGADVLIRPGQRRCAPREPLQGLRPSNRQQRFLISIQVAHLNSQSGPLTHPLILLSRFLTGCIEEVSAGTGVGRPFLGLIVLPIAGNAAEHFTAVVVAARGKADLALAIALGSCVQVRIACPDTNPDKDPVPNPDSTLRQPR